MAQSGPASQHATGTGTVLLGLGNDLLTDDAVGLRIAGTLAEDDAVRNASIHVIQTTEMGLALMDLVTGFDKLIVVDSIQTGKAKPGFLHQFQAGDIEAFPVISPHFLGIGEMLALGRELGLQMPAEIRVFAVEVADPYTVGTSLSPALQRALPGLIGEIRSAILGG